ncbi:PREDICTED: putative leucine-rich repeat-containing protein DDB_G0290503 [Polistes canadensis]|uniref:putative leucine-rich repeat-containing protein DDB_G0290503 n=1 Tax=Polistes canadensis TaxID=91411 RepID=UPI000718D857|nr:PREDICTED: putative leucine-rich repeat-containing protein DDB_G0290503 [Polistes canadensis]
MDSEDIDIYEDLPSFDDKTDFKDNEDIFEQCEKLKKEVSELKLQLENAQNVKETLEVNLSSLLKTAKAEISRKDRMIAELRKQVDDMTFKRGHFNKNVKDCNKSVQQLPENNVHEYNHAKTYAENEELPNFNSNNDKYDPVASNSSETNFQHFESVNFNQSNEDQATDYEHLNNQFCNTKYHSKKLPVPNISSTTIYTERVRKKIMEEEEVEKKQKLLLQETNEQNTHINIDDKENHSYPSILNSNVNDTILENKEVVCNFTDNINITEGNTVCPTNQQKLAASNNDSKKRPNNVDTPCNKRQKLDVEQNMCTDKTNISDEDVCFGFDHEMASIKDNKLNSEENSNPYTERNVRSNSKYDKDSRSHSTSYRKEKEYYKKFSNDHNNYSKDSVEYYREKDKYSHKRNRSPVLKHSDRKHKHYDDRYNKDYRDKYRDRDRRRSSQDKEDNISITSNKSYKDKSRLNEKYGTTDFHSSKSKGNKYSSLRGTKHEKSRRKIKERTKHKTVDRKYSKHSKYDRNLEDRESTHCERKGKINEFKAINVVKKTNNFLNKSIKIRSSDSLEEGEILSPIKSNLNNETDNIKFISEKNVNVETCKDSFKITFDQFEDKLKPAANRMNTRTCLTRKDRENVGDKENMHQIEKVEAAIAVNTCPEDTNMPLVDNKLNCTVTSTNIIPILTYINNDDKNVIIHENKSKFDKIVQLQKNAKESDSTRNNIQYLPEEILRSNTKISAEISQENNIVFKYNDKKEDKSLPNISKVGLRKDNVFSVDKLQKENDNDQQESLEKVHEETVAIDLQENNKYNNNKSVKAKATRNNKKEISKCDDSEVVIFARRRRHINLTDNNASMTVIINPKNTNLDVSIKNNVENNLKQRACKISRSYKDLCKDDI